MRHVVVMVATSYPRFAGDGVGSFMEPIAKGVAALGHEVHLVAPWHPAITRGTAEDGVFFHFFRYAPSRSLNVFGYAEGLEADTRLRAATWVVAPVAMAAGWFKALRVAQKRKATIMHGHWAVPGGLIAAEAAGDRPLVVSLHGSDIFVAERNRLARRAAQRAFRRAGWITACSDDLRTRAVALGADPARIETVPYGVNLDRFRPDAAARHEIRATLGIGNAPLVFSAGRLVSKKGFEYLIDAATALVADFPGLRVVIGGEGDLRRALESRIAAAGARHVTLAGNLSQDAIARYAAAADVIAVPSIRDDAGNVDGLPNFALESLASGTPVVASRAGGLPQAIEDGVTGRLVAERDAVALADAIADLLRRPDRARALGTAARARAARDFSWTATAERMTQAYEKAIHASV